MMADPAEVELLRARDLALYGNTNGPTFAFLVEQGRRAGLTEPAIYEAIIEGAYRTNVGLNVGLTHRTWRMGLCRQKRKIILKKRLLGNQAQIHSIPIEQSMREGSA